MDKNIKEMNYKELKELSSKVSEFIIENVSKTGGHLASNLGTVDLEIALLKVFNFDKDKIIFDVGHQAYTYKILTGRKNQFNTLRKFNGISGFPKRSESKYDFFDTGHSSNSISAALGFALSRDLNKEDYNVIALIGDGAMTGGEAFEGLNNLGSSKTRMIVILNDNGQSISTSVGGLATKLNNIRISKTYLNLKQEIKKCHKSVDKLRNIKNRLKNLIIPNKLFENLGLKYVGPIDGHNIEELIKTLEKIKNIHAPILLHVVTTKGKGYEFAMQNPELYHGVSAFNKNAIIELKKTNYSYYFGESLVEIAKNNSKVVAITAAMKDGTGLEKFSKEFPKRFFDVGIAEQHAVTLAAGLAANGYKPVVAIYSTFLQRAYDQMLIDVCMQNLPVVFAIDRSGLVGADGETHQGIFDNSYLLHMPSLEIIAPKCVEEIKPILEYAIGVNNPVAIKYSRNAINSSKYALKSIKKGKWQVINKGKKVVLITVGNMFNLGLEIIKENKEIGLVNATFIKPLDQELLSSFKNYHIITIEDNQIIGGFGSEVLLYLNKIGYKNKIEIVGYDDKFVKQGTVQELLEDNFITVEHIKKIIEKLNNNDII